MGERAVRSRASLSEGAVADQRRLDVRAVCGVDLPRRVIASRLGALFRLVQAALGQDDLRESAQPPAYRSLLERRRAVAKRMKLI